MIDEPKCSTEANVFSPVSQAEETRAFLARLPLTLRDAGQHGRARQAPEASRGHVLLRGRELPAHVGPTGATLSNCPGISED